VESKFLWLVPFSAFIFVLLMMRLRLGWRAGYYGLARADPRTIDGERVTVRVTPRSPFRDRLLVMEFCVPASWHFCVRHKNWFDRLGKALHLVREPEVGDPAFDQLFFLKVDCPAFLRLPNPQFPLCQQLGALAVEMTASQARLQRIDCSAGKLSVVIKFAWTFEFPRTSSISSEKDSHGLFAAKVLYWLKRC